MGFTGRILTVRSVQPLDGRPELGGVKVIFEVTSPDGWRSAHLDGDPRGVLPAMVAVTGAPVVTAYILDSDVADVEALTPGGIAWHTYLHPALAASYGAPTLPQSADEVVRLALAWSAEAGLSPDQDALARTLEAKNVEATDTYDELLAALGIAEFSY